MTASEDFTSDTDPFRAEPLAHCYAHALRVLTVVPGGITRIVIFLDAGLFGSFRLPETCGPALAGPALAGPALAGPALAGPALAGPVPAGAVPAGHRGCEG